MRFLLFASMLPLALSAQVQLPHLGGQAYILVKDPEDKGRAFTPAMVFPILFVEASRDPVVEFEPMDAKPQGKGRRMPGAVVEVVAPLYSPAEFFKIMVQTQWKPLFTQSYSVGRSNRTTVQGLRDFMSVPLDRYIAPKAASVWSNSMFPEEIKVRGLLEAHERILTQR